MLLIDPHDVECYATIIYFQRIVILIVHAHASVAINGWHRKNCVVQYYQSTSLLSSEVTTDLSCVVCGEIAWEASYLLVNGLETMVLQCRLQWYCHQLLLLLVLVVIVHGINTQSQVSEKEKQSCKSIELTSRWKLEKKTYQFHALVVQLNLIYRL